MKIRKILSSAGMILVAALLLLWCFRQVDLSVIVRDLYRVKFSSLLLAIVILSAILWVKSVQWQLFLPPHLRVSLKSMLEIIAVMLMMANTLPWGQAFAIYHLGHLKKTGKMVAVSVMTLDQISTGFSKLAIFLLAALLTPLPVWMKKGILITILSVLGAYFILLILAYKHRNFQDTDILSHPRWWNRFIHYVSKWAHHLHALRDFKKTSLAIGLGLMVKIIEVGAIYAVQSGFGLTLPWWSAIFVVAGLNLATMVPVTPGNLGVFEATAFFIYKFLGIEPSQAMSLALFQHLVYLIPMVLPGCVFAIKAGFKKEPYGSVQPKYLNNSN